MITLYTRPGCQGCRMSKSFLDRNNIPYQMLDIDQDEVAKQTVQELGYSTLPVIVTPDTNWYGFKPDMLAKLVA